jgi:RNA polymerase sigma factor (sigma-70 family)
MNRPTIFDPAGTREFHEFLGRVRPKLRRMLMAWNVPIEDAEDLLQESLLVLLRNEEQMDKVANREAWLLGVLRHTILLYFRRNKRERRFREALSLELPGSESAPQERQDSARDLAALTASMPQRDLQALWLRYGLELKPSEAARTLGCQPDSVRKLSNRALARLRRQLAEEDDG